MTAASSPVPADRAPRSLAELTDGQRERFARQLTLVGFGPEAQLALLRARVLVVGAGGLGSPVLQYLAAAGVGEIHVVDDDVVDRSNLHRQVIHAEADLDRAKTASAAETIRGLHPEARVVEHRERLTSQNALERVRGMDLVVDGADTYATRYLVADACEIARVPVVWGAVLRFAGQVSVFAPGGPLYRDVFPEEPDPGTVPTCAEAGVVGVLPGIVGSVMAAEAVKALTGVGQTLTGRLLSVDVLTLRFTEHALAADPDRTPVVDLAAHAAAEAEAAAARGMPGPGEVAADALAAMLVDPDAGAVRVLDVRDAAERALGVLEPCDHVPLADVLAAPAAQAPDEGMTLVVLCAAGVRSARARDAVRAAAPAAAGRVLSLAGGLRAWEARGEAARPACSVDSPG